MSTESLDESVALLELLRRELVSVPIENWGYFFPAHLAVWRFIRSKRPQALGELQAGYDTEPYFNGTGATWFVESLGNDEAYLDLLESIMYPLAQSLPSEARKRGFLRSHELPPLDAEIVGSLETVALDRTDRAIARGEL